MTYEWFFFFYSGRAKPLPPLLKTEMTPLVTASILNLGELSDRKSHLNGIYEGQNSKVNTNICILYHHEIHSIHRYYSEMSSRFFFFLIFRGYLLAEWIFWVINHVFPRLDYNLKSKNLVFFPLNSVMIIIWA